MILIVEDERDLVDTLEYALNEQGFSTLAARTGRRALEVLAGDRTPALVLLDLMLPDMSGLDLCRQLRACARTRALPVIVLTARAEETEHAAGLAAGADEYMVKPFSLRELLRRIHAALRRQAPAESKPAQYGRLLLDEDGHRVWLDDHELSLSALEFRLLTTLAGRSGRVYTREGLLASVSNAQPGLTPHGVDLHVRRLRDKLGTAAPYVQTLGTRYCFSAGEGEA